MFIRKNKNRNNSISVQIISKHRGKYKVVKTIGTGKTEQQIEFLYQRARQYIQQSQGTINLFVNREDALIESYLKGIKNSQIQVIGPELIFGKIYDAIGFDQVKEELFRHLVITRLYQPGSKLKTIDYLYRFMGIRKSVDEIYRFLDKLGEGLKEQIEQIAFRHTSKVVGKKIGIVFYDMTTLHFESSDEDDLRKTGFSKEGKHQHPQIYLGLLVSVEGFPIGYDIFEGNIFEGHTLIPTLQKFEKKFNQKKPIVIADAGLLTGKNILSLQANGYKYIHGGRIKNESKEIKERILKEEWFDNNSISIKKDEHTRLLVAYSTKRAEKDEHNRKRGFNRIEKELKQGKLTKSNLNNRGYNKYLKLIGQLTIEIDYDKYQADKCWDGLKGYVTNTKLNPEKIIENYNQLWHIEKAFRISKTDLRIRPIYHRLKNRIDGHICIAFSAYLVYKELERILKKEGATISAKRAADLTHNIYQLNIVLPESQHQKSVLLKMDDEQSQLYQTIIKNF
jgi:transposase